MKDLKGVSSAFIHSSYFYSASSSPLLLRGAPDKARILCQSFMPKRHRQQTSEGLAQGPYVWGLVWDSNLRPFVRKAANLPMSHHAPQLWHCDQFLKTSLCLLLQMLLNYMATVGYHPKLYALCFSYPRQQISDNPMATLEELGIVQDVLLNVEEKD